MNDRQLTCTSPFLPIRGVHRRWWSYCHLYRVYRNAKCCVVARILLVLRGWMSMLKRGRWFCRRLAWVFAPLVSAACACVTTRICYRAVPRCRAPCVGPASTPLSADAAWASTSARLFLKKDSGVRHAPRSCLRVCGIHHGICFVLPLVVREFGRFSTRVNSSGAWQQRALAG